MILHSLWNDLFAEETIRKQLDAARRKRDIEQGRTEEKISLARKLISLGSMSREEIAKITELPLEQIDELAS